MNETEKDKDYIKYFNKELPSEINVQKDDIFYREKYTEIINYIKIMLSKSKELELYHYLKPRGIILINTEPGTDLIDYIKLISKNYFLNYYELNYVEISNSSDFFLKNFIETIKGNILNNLNEESKLKVNKSKISSDQNDESQKKVLFLINLDENLSQLFNEKNLLRNFVYNLKNNPDFIDFIDKNAILILVLYNYNKIIELSNIIYEVFDIFVKIPLLTDIERESVLRNFSERNPRIVFDINLIVSYTNGWEVKDLNHLLKIAIFKHYLDSDLNNVSNEITETIISLIESGEFIASNLVKKSNHEGGDENNPNHDIIVKQESQYRELESKYGKERKELINEIRNEPLSEFMLNQLYEDAASKNFNELLIIIDKLKNNEPLEDNSRKLIAKFPFILNDTPNMAQINLEKAKKRIDLMKKAFGK